MKKKKSEKLEEKITVICRVRKINKNLLSPHYLFNFKEEKIEINAEKKILNKISNTSSYSFSKIMKTSTTQEEMHSTIIPQFLKDSFIENRPSLIFTYGVTNSGKTYTMIGEIFPTKDSSPENINLESEIGILPKICIDLLQIKTMLKNSDYFTIKEKFPFFAEKLEIRLKEECWCLSDLEIKFSCFEIYRKKIIELLDENQTGKSLKITERNKAIIIKGLKKNILNTEKSLKILLDLYNRNKKVADNKLNRNSSRSHTIFKIGLKGIYTKMTTKSNKKSKNIFQEETFFGDLTLIDLAGSERVKRTKLNGEGIKDASFINNSLMSLRMCLDAMRKRKKEIPFRNSLLTKVISEAFVFDHRIKLIVALNPSSDDFFESCRALNFASRAKTIKKAESFVKARRYFYSTPRKKKKFLKDSEEKIEKIENEKTNLEILVEEKKSEIENMEKEIEIRDSTIKKLKLRLENLEEKADNLLESTKEKSTKKFNLFGDKLEKLREVSQTCTYIACQKMMILKEFSNIYPL